MAGYCRSVVHYGTPMTVANQSPAPAGWTCQQQINANLACMWQFRKSNVVARQNQGKWVCYLVS